MADWTKDHFFQNSLPSTHSRTHTIFRYAYDVYASSILFSTFIIIAALRGSLSTRINIDCYLEIKHTHEHRIIAEKSIKLICSLAWMNVVYILSICRIISKRSASFLECVVCFMMFCSISASLLFIERFLNKWHWKRCDFCWKKLIYLLFELSFYVDRWIWNGTNHLKWHFNRTESALNGDELELSVESITLSLRISYFVQIEKCTLISGSLLAM